MPDLDLEIKVAPVIQTLRKGVARSPKEFFRPFGPQFGLKIRGGGGVRAPRAPPLDPPLDFVAVTYDLCVFFSLFFHLGNETRLNQTDDKPFTSHPPHETDHTTGSMLLSSRKDVGCSTSYQSRIGTSAEHWRRGKSTVFAFIREECCVDERTSRR